MTPLSIRIGKRTYQATLPQTWAEIPADAWQPLYAEMSKGEHLFSRELLHLLMRDKRGKRLGWRVISLIPLGHLGHFFECLAWLLTEPMSSPHRPYIRLGGKSYFLPGPKFNNLTVIEFAFLDMAWQLRTYYVAQKAEPQAEEWQARLLATICRPKDKRKAKRRPDDYAGDVRQTFNPALIEDTWPQFRKVAIWEQAWVLRYLSGCKQAISQAYPNLWPSQETDYRESLAKVADFRPQPKRWIDLCRQMSGGKFGTFEETQRTDLYIFLDELSAQLKEQKRREREAAHRKAFRK